MLLDQDVQRVRVLHPSDQPRVLTERNDGVPSDLQVFLVGLRVDRQERIDQSKQLHDTLILTNVLMTLQKKDVLSSITAVKV